MRKAGIAAGWIFAGAVAVWAVLRLFGLDAWYPAVQVIAFTPYAVLVAALGVSLFGWRRRWAELAVTAVSAVVLAACVIPRAVTDGDALAGATGPELRVASANLLIGGADAAEIVRRVRTEQADVLAVQEMTPEWLAAADAAGLGDVLPQRFVAPASLAEGSALFSRRPLSDGGSKLMAFGWFQQVHAVITVDGVPLTLESAHPASPYNASVTPAWRTSLRKEPDATPTGPLRVLMGDFNSTLDHGLLRDLVSSGYRDAASVVGQGLVGTWGPYNGDPPLGSSAGSGISVVFRPRFDPEP
ncbi:MAG: endonuclease/exonuclease/phosphatase family protein [Hamadaea sp.]|uniref:endonuclease/exonuclease/phosphatase family protein n=1 Tax=Hamadaea sp. TaxID=2024425 RepID=UPI0017AFEC1F|nr:endonuclease/exonuclease/phosphatase family protein [Hamadaea sp.]NUT21036.1 endonuclease/exonuclease/phosphatase family protein [Hamadaea sp.]